MKKVIFVLVCLISVYQAVWGTLISEQLYQVLQPDGKQLDCLVSGDEFYHYLHDKDGYTIVQSDADGFYYYAEKVNERLVPSRWKAGQDNPDSNGLIKNSHISLSDYQRIRNQPQYTEKRRLRVYTPNTGTVNNLVFFIRFAGDSEFGTHRSEFEDIFNGNGQSLKSYYSEVSYNQLNFNSYLYPTCSASVNLSYQDTHPRSYYLTYNQVSNPTGYTSVEQGWQRILQLLQRATSNLDGEIPTSLNLDTNDDSYVDNVCYVLRGGAGAWGDILWAQHGCLIGNTIQIHGKSVQDFTLSPETQTNVSVHAHEMFHAIGSPDLYEYSQTGFLPVGPWDIMQGNNSSHMLAYMKYRYGGWIPEPSTITQRGFYTLNPQISNVNNCYKIPMPASGTEYLMVEYRNNTMGIFDTDLPGSGLICYRINTLYDGQGNAYGPPDEVMVYCPNGTNLTNGFMNQAFFSLESGRTEFDDFSNPADFLSDGSFGNVSINQIDSAGESINFCLFPAYGVIEGNVLVNDPDVDFSQIDICIGSQVIVPDSEGHYSFYYKEGTYPISVEVPGYAVYHSSETVISDVMIFHDINLVHLEVPSNLTCTQTGTSISFNWNFSGFSDEDFETFKILRKVNNFQYGQIGSTQQTTYQTTLIGTTMTSRFCVVAQYADGTSDSSNVVVILPTHVEPNEYVPVFTQLKSIYPNPSAADVNIIFELAKGDKPEFSIYNIKGQKVCELMLPSLKQGENSLLWNRVDKSGKVIQSGIYFLRMKSKQGDYQKKLILY